MIPLTNYDFQWARSELVIIYPDNMSSRCSSLERPPSQRLERPGDEVEKEWAHGLRSVPLRGRALKNVGAKESAFSKRGKGIYKQEK